MQIALQASRRCKTCFLFCSTCHMPFTKGSCKSVSPELFFRVRVPQQGLSHLRKCPARVFSKSPTRMFCRSLPQKCLIRVLQQDCLPRVHSRSTHSSVRRGCLKGLYGKNVVQQCSRAGLAEVFHKTVSQEFGTWVSCKSVF